MTTDKECVKSLYILVVKEMVTDSVLWQHVNMSVSKVKAEQLNQKIEPDQRVSLLVIGLKYICINLSSSRSHSTHLHLQPATLLRVIHVQMSVVQNQSAITLALMVFSKTDGVAPPVNVQTCASLLIVLNLVLTVWYRERTAQTSLNQTVWPQQNLFVLKMGHPQVSYQYA